MATYMTIGNARPADVAVSNDGNTIYASYDDGWVRSYDRATGALLQQWHVGTDLGAIDLSPDGSFLAIIEDHPVAGQQASPWWNTHYTVATYKLDLASGTVGTYLQTTNEDEYTFFDLGVLSDGRVLLTSNIFPGWSGWAPMEFLDYSTGQYTRYGSVRHGSWLAPATDGSVVMIAEADTSDAPIEVYKTATNSMAGHGLYADGVSGFNNGVQAVSGAAGLAAQGLGNHVYIYGFDAKLKIDLATRGYNVSASAMAFDASGARLWIFDSTSHALMGFSTASWDIAAIIPVAGSFSVGGGYGNGLTVLNGSQFLLTTPTGMMVVTASTVPTSGNDELSGTLGADTIGGGDGDDSIVGLAGNDNLNGEGGNDVLAGGDGDDSLSGGAGQDSLFGDKGADQLSGGDGDDNLRGGAGVDSFDGGADDGAENLDTGFGDKVSFFERTATQAVVADLRTGTISNDGFGNAETMTGVESLGAGTRFADTFYGNDNRNYLWGSLGDKLYGFGGDDIIFLDSKPQSVDGGDGVDELRLSTDGGWLTDDRDYDGIADFAAASTFGWAVNLADHLLGENRSGSVGQSVTGIENVTGSALADSLIGDDGANVLKGGAGDDRVSGRGGNDTLYGGDGLDIMGGGDGDDRIYGEAGDDEMSEGFGIDSFDGGDNTDVVRLYRYGDMVGFNIATATQGVVADLRTGIISNDGTGSTGSMTGIESLNSNNAYADTLYGNDVRNYLLGSTGDSLYGFGGDDIINLAGAGTADGGAGWDRLELYAYGGLNVPDWTGDGIADKSPAMTSGWTVNLAAGTMVDGYGNSGSVAGIEEVVGSHLADTLTGDGADNRFDGAAGNDVFDLSAGGNDTVLGGDGNDYVYFGAAFTAADTVDGGAGTDTVGLLGNYNLTLGANTLSGVETFSLLSGTAAGGTEHVTYSITTVDANVPAGGRLTVYAGGLLADESLFFNGYAETDGALSVYGGAGNDTFAGGPANDAFVGGAGNDLMYGLGGADWLEGGLGADGMRGGLGNDVFVYQSAAESTAAATDHIFDFEDISDHISLTKIDADANAAGDQAFTFIGGNAFSNTAGELRAYQSGSSWFVEGDVNGDGTADLVIQVDTFGGHAMTASDFYL